MAGSNGKPNQPGPQGMPEQGPLIEYPCDWSFTVIGDGADRIAAAIPEVLAGSRPQWRPHHASRTGRYASFHVVVRVDTKAHRDHVYAQLKSIPGVRFVL